MEAGEASFWRIESMQPSSSSISHQQRHQPPPLTSSSSSSVPTDSILISSPYVSPLIMFPPSPHQYVPAGSPLLPFPTLPHSHSWTQLVLNNEDRSCGGVSHYHQNPKKLENWDGDEEDPSSYLNLWPRGVSVPSVNSVDVTKQEEVVESQISNSYSVGDAKEYCVATSSSTSNMLDFSRNKVADGEDHYTDHQSSECNSTATKKARVSSSTQPPLKVRKEKLGDRITALHQLVSPFGKTDTASVLLEAIGYIRFLQGQIEALSSPYLGNVRTHHSAQGERSCIFPEDPGQLLNIETCLKRRGAPDDDQDEHELAKDLRSRGLCLVPLACTQQVETEVNGAEFWAQAQGGGAF